MNNWKDYVGYQPLNEEELPKAYYTLAYTVQTADNGSSFVSPRINRVLIDVSEMTLTEDTVGQAVEDVLLTFPTQEIKSIDGLQLAKNKVEAAGGGYGRRSIANCNGAWYHKGDSVMDNAVYVIGYKGQYAVKKHPDFDNYGFKIAESI